MLDCYIKCVGISDLGVHDPTSSTLSLVEHGRLGISANTLAPLGCYIELYCIRVITWRDVGSL